MTPLGNTRKRAFTICKYLAFYSVGFSTCVKSIPSRPFFISFVYLTCFFVNCVANSGTLREFSRNFPLNHPKKCNKFYNLSHSEKITTLSSSLFFMLFGPQGWHHSFVVQKCQLLPRFRSVALQLSHFIFANFLCLYIKSSLL